MGKDKNYKFVQNSKCEYFPCHKVKDEENLIVFLFLSTIYVKG